SSSPSPRSSSRAGSTGASRGSASRWTRLASASPRRWCWAARRGRPRVSRPCPCLGRRSSRARARRREPAAEPSSVRRRRRRRGRRHGLGSTELELLPMLNVFIAIIPLLLMSAAFVQVSVIQASLPAEAAAPVDTHADVALDLTVTIHEDAYIVEAAGTAPTT